MKRRLSGMILKLSKSSIKQSKNAYVLLARFLFTFSLCCDIYFPFLSLILLFSARRMAFRIVHTLSTIWRSVSLSCNWRSLGSLFIVLTTSFMLIGLDERASFENAASKTSYSSIVRRDCAVFLDPDIEGTYSLISPHLSASSTDIKVFWRIKNAYYCDILCASTCINLVIFVSVT